MKITVITKTNARQESVTRTDLFGREMYKVSVKESPIDGKANNAIIKVLAKYFDVAPSSIRLSIGVSSKLKVFEW